MTIIEEEGLRLQDVDRAFLTDRLLENLTPTPPTLRADCIKELDSRVDVMCDGEILKVDGPQATTKLRSKFSR